MKPHPPPHRIRKTIKWGGAVMTVLLVVVWVGSGWFRIEYQSRTATHAFSAKLGCGEVGVESFSNARRHWELDLREWRFVPTLFSLNWSTEWYQDFVGWTIRVPLLPFAAIPIVVSSITLRLASLARRLIVRARRRARLNLCPKCNYDRTGLAIGAKCPECGAVPSS